MAERLPIDLFNIPNPSVSYVYNFLSSQPHSGFIAKNISTPHSLDEHAEGARKELVEYDAALERLHDLTSRVQAKRHALSTALKTLRVMSSAYINMLPAELLTAIFVFCWEDSDREKGGTKATLTLAHVCSRWRNNVFANAKLWSRLDISMNFNYEEEEYLLPTIDKLEFVRFFLDQSKDQPLEILYTYIPPPPALHPEGRFAKMLSKHFSGPRGNLALGGLLSPQAGLLHTPVSNAANLYMTDNGLLPVPIPQSVEAVLEAILQSSRRWGKMSLHLSRPVQTSIVPNAFDNLEDLTISGGEYYTYNKPLFSETSEETQIAAPRLRVVTLVNTGTMSLPQLTGLRSLTHIVARGHSNIEFIISLTKQATKSLILDLDVQFTYGRAGFQQVWNCHRTKALTLTFTDTFSILPSLPLISLPNLDSFVLKKDLSANLPSRRPQQPHIRNAQKLITIFEKTTALTSLTFLPIPLGDNADGFIDILQTLPSLTRLVMYGESHFFEKVIPRMTFHVLPLLEELEIGFEHVQRGSRTRLISKVLPMIQTMAKSRWSGPDEAGLLERLKLVYYQDQVNSKDQKRLNQLVEQGLDIEVREQI